MREPTQSVKRPARRAATSPTRAAENDSRAPGDLHAVTSCPSLEARGQEDFGRATGGRRDDRASRAQVARDGDGAAVQPGQRASSLKATRRRSGRPSVSAGVPRRRVMRRRCQSKSERCGWRSSSCQSSLERRNVSGFWGSGRSWASHPKATSTKSRPSCAAWSKPKPGRSCRRYLARASIGMAQVRSFAGVEQETPAVRPPLLPDTRSARRDSPHSRGC